MNATIRMTPAAMKARALLAECAAYAPGSLDRQWRARAAWKLTQMDRGIPVNRWTETPQEPQ